MTFCSNCGGNIVDGIKFCSSCGKEVKVNHTETNLNITSTQNTNIVDKKSQATASLILGIIGLIAWVLPLFGFPVTIIGLIMGIVGQKSTKKNMAMAGIVLSIIGLVITIINSAIGAYQGATGTHPLF